LKELRYSEQWLLTAARQEPSATALIPARSRSCT